MCNLYSITRSQEAMRRLPAVTRGLTVNLPPLPSGYPHGVAIIAREGATRAPKRSRPAYRR